MAEKNAPFRADHVGSLLRPPELLRAREQHQKGELSAVALRQVEDRELAPRRSYKKRSVFRALPTANTAAPSGTPIFCGSSKA